MRSLTWLRFAVPVDGVYWRESREPPDLPRRREGGSNRPADSHRFPEEGAQETATSAGNNKWIYLR